MDSKTIPSYFSQISNQECLNLSLMAGNSEMETIAMIPYTNKNNKFISITGNNTLFNELIKLVYTKGDEVLHGHESMMPFNETMWKRIYEEDILYNSYILRNDIDPNGFFKTKEDLKKIQRKADQKINRENTTQTF